MTYRLVAFDFDGVLADSADFMIGMVPAVCRKFGLRQVDADEIAALRGQPSREVVRRMGVKPWQLPAMGKHVRQLAHEAADQIPVFAGVDSLLAALKANGVITAVVTSNGEEAVRAVLGQANAARIDHYICGVGLFGKAGKLKALRRRVGVAHAEAAYVGDETRDVDAARKAGWASFAAGWGYATPEVLHAARPMVFVETVLALEARLAP